MTITAQIDGHVPGFTGQGWHTQETMHLVKWIFTNEDVLRQALDVAREYPGNPHTVADTLHEHLVPRAVLEDLAASGGDPAAVDWLEIAHELIERRNDPQPGQEHASITAQALDLAAAVTVAPAAMTAPGLPVPGDRAAIAMFTAHRVDGILHNLAHAAGRMTAARAAAGALRAYHCTHVARHLASALDDAHWLTANLREHYPAEAAELEQVRQAVGLTGQQAAALDLAAWEHEARGGHGEWITLYHGTSRENADSIAKTGLHVSEGHIYPAKWPVTTVNRQTADAYASRGAGDRATVKIRIPKSRASEFLWPAQDHMGGAAYALKKDIPAKMVAGVRPVTGFVDYPADMAVADDWNVIGLAKAVSSAAKSATTAHLLETTLHELTHGSRHAEAMTADTDPDGAEWEFNADHCEKHLAGAVEHAGKLAVHFTDNYPAEAKWLAGLDKVTADAEEGGGKQHARYGGTAQLAASDWEGWRTEPRDEHGQFFHGTSAVLKPGDLVETGHPATSRDPRLENVNGLQGQYNHVSRSVKVATRYADRAATVAHNRIGRLRAARDENAAAHVYEVEPTGPVEADPDGRPGEDFRTTHPVRVVREVAPEQDMTVSGQARLIDLRGWEGWRDEPRDRDGRWTRGGAGLLEKVTEPIRGEGARGNSRPVSEDEFHQMAAEGRDRLHDIQHQPWTTEGMRKNWEAIKARTYAEVQKSWGGATIDPRSGQDLPQGADKYAMSIKPTGLDTTSIDEHASREQFDEAMNIALSKYGKQLAKGGSYLGVFHDDDLNRIDIDPVTVLDSLRQVETIGAYTHAIGGAYHFASGDGFWPPHVPEHAAAAMSTPVGSGHHFRGPGHWHSQAVAVQQPHDEPEDTGADEDTEPPAGIISASNSISGQVIELDWETEDRGPGGRWFHGTSDVHKPGDVIDPAVGHRANFGPEHSDPKSVYIAGSVRHALHYAERDRGGLGDPHVYEVEPTGKHWPIAAGSDQHQTKSPVRIIREVPSSGVELSWRDAWRAELRGHRGEWVKSGEGDEITKLENQISRTEHISKSDEATAGRLIARSAPIVPHMFGPDTHLDWDGKPPTTYSKWSPSMGNDLAIMDWNGHMDMRNDVAAGIADAENNPDQPVKVPGAYAVNLHELIHAVVPEGQSRETNGDKEAYNMSMGNADIEEGFTELGAIQHAGEYFGKLGIGDRPIARGPGTDAPHAPPGATMSDLAANKSSPDAIRTGDSWGHYPQQTAQAFEWASMTAQMKTGKPENDPATMAAIRDIADQVNAVGTLDKPNVMARQVIGDMLPANQQQAYAMTVAAAANIADDWDQGHASTPADLRAAAAQKLQQLQAEEGKAA